LDSIDRHGERQPYQGANAYAVEPFLKKDVSSSHAESAAQWP
jgi:hypothetical protein